jgi:hypothetical protein
VLDEHVPFLEAARVEQQFDALAGVSLPLACCASMRTVARARAASTASAEQVALAASAARDSASSAAASCRRARAHLLEARTAASRTAVLSMSRISTSSRLAAVAVDADDHLLAAVDARLARAADSSMRSFGMPGPPPWSCRPGLDLVDQLRAWRPGSAVRLST